MKTHRLSSVFGAGVVGPVVMLCDVFCPEGVNDARFPGFPKYRYSSRMLQKTGVSVYQFQTVPLIIKKKTQDKTILHVVDIFFSYMLSFYILQLHLVLNSDWTVDLLAALGLMKVFHLFIYFILTRQLDLFCTLCSTSQQSAGFPACLVTSSGQSTAVSLPQVACCAPPVPQVAEDTVPGVVLQQCEESLQEIRQC